ncbi:MAG: response regulator [Magnetococcales bacterium]|nr:response regulator [Magnetococcales bacterium]
MKLSLKLILLCSGLVTLTGIGIATFAYTITAKALKREVMQQTELRASSILSNLDKQLYTQLSDIKLVTTDPVFCHDDFEANSSFAAKRLLTYRNNFKVFQNITFFDMAGVIGLDTSSMSLGQKRTAEQFPEKFWQTSIQKGAALGVGYSSLLGKNMVFFSAKVSCEKEDTPRGLIVGQMALSRLHTIFGEVIQNEIVGKQKIDLATQDGLLLYSNYNQAGILKSRMPFHDYEHASQEQQSEEIYHWEDNEDSMTLYVVEPGYMDFAGNNWLLKFHQSKDWALFRATDLRNQIIAVSLPSILLAIIIAWFFAMRFTVPINRLMDAFREITTGNKSFRTQIEGKDEVWQLARDFNFMAQSLEEQDWQKSNVTFFSEIIQKTKNLPILAQEIISNLTPILNGGYGAIYIHNKKTDKYHLMGSYGVNEEYQITKEFMVGDGLLGQCAMEKKQIIQTDVPGDYIKINSGLGAASPLNSLMLPLLYKGNVIAVIEIASFKQFSKNHETLLEELSPILGIGLENQSRSQRTEELLEETQIQANEMATLAEELQAQQEELHKSNIKLKEKNLVVSASEEELLLQQEELQTTNQELENRTRQLENQKEELVVSQGEIEKKAIELGEASRYKSEFLANMSHELRNPLNSLMIISQQLASNSEGNLTHEQVESAGIVYKSGQDLLSLINDILDLAKIESGKTDLYIEDVDIRVFANDIDHRFRHMAEDKGLAWKVEVANESPEYIKTDQGKFGQIVKNLISNAVKFTERGLISIRFHPHTGICNLAVTVTDTGIGIADEKLSLIFEAFQQADGATTRNYGGTGLGLSISKELAAMLGGEIKVKSRVDRGSTFTLCMKEDPQNSDATIISKKISSLQSEPISVVDAVEDDRDNVESGDRAILVIEDDPAFAGILCGISHKKGFKCLVAADGAMGLELAGRYQPDGIILDLTLPGHLDGMGVMERLKGNPATRDIPIHMISGSDKSREGIAKGAVSFLNKPVTAEQLDDVFKNIADSTTKKAVKILIVEPDSATSKTISDLIAKKPVEIATASHGEEAFSLLRKQSFDCIILNPDLPDLRGCDLLDRINNDVDILNPMVIIHSDKKLSRREDAKFKEYTDSIVIKSARSEKRLLNEVSHFFHEIESGEGQIQRQENLMAQDKETIFAGKKVLVVDDDMRNTYALTSALGSRGLKTEIADTGEWALKKLDEHQDIDIVLMDIMMPGMDGYQTMGKIREQERFSDLPIIAITAKAMANDREKCLLAGANEYLAKPIEMDRLFSLLRVWLPGHKDS